MEKGLKNLQSAARNPLRQAQEGDSGIVMDGEPADTQSTHSVEEQGHLEKPHLPDRPLRTRSPEMPSIASIIHPFSQ